MLADSRLIEGVAAMTAGDLLAAEASFVVARRIFDELSVLDLSNRRWVNAVLNVRLMEAILAARQGNYAAAGKITFEIRPRIAQQLREEGSSRAFTVVAIKARLVDAYLCSGSDTKLAATHVNEALKMVEQLIEDHRNTRADVGMFAQAYVDAGELAARNGELALAQTHWQRADELIRPLLEGCRDWRLLDPAARIAVEFGRKEDARKIVEQLNIFGYIPLKPWPPEIAHGVAAPPP